MKTRLSLFYVCLFVCFQACQSDETEAIPGLSGIVTASGSPISNASVTLANDVSTYTTSTGIDGRFAFREIAKAEYILTIKAQGSNNKFVQYQKNVRVLSENTEQAIELPEAPSLIDPSNVTDRSVEIKWTKSDISDFLEYKLYRHNSSGLDETTGELIHIAMNANDTVFTDTKVRESETYFYRVFVRNTFGLYGGSNIVETVTTVGNYIKNGDFEAGFDNWRQLTLTNPASLSEDITSPAGKMVLDISSLGTKDYFRGIMYHISQNNFIPGEAYVLSFWAKIDKPDNVGVYVVLVEPGVTAPIALTNLMSESEPSKEWTKHTLEFFAPTLFSPPHLSIYPTVFGPKTGTEVFSVLLDGFEIHRK